MLDASSRLLRLLSLLTSRRLWEGPALSGELDVTERTLRRDIEKLRALGYPVRSTSGVAGGYQLGAGAKLPPLLLDSEEALAVALGLRSAATGAITGAEAVATRALAKLEQVLPARIRRQVQALSSSVVSLRWGAPAIDADSLMVLAAACRNRELIKFQYEDAKGQPSARQVQPHGLVCSGARWYLVAWDLKRLDFRTFRVDRIAKPSSTGETFVPRALPHGSVEAYLSHALASWPQEETGKVLVHASFKTLARHISPTTASIEEVGIGKCTVTAGRRALLRLCLYFAAFDVVFDEVAPQSLADELSVVSERLQRAVGRKG